MDYSPPGSFVHGISQARTLEWVATSFSRRSFPPRDQTRISCIGGISFATEAPGKPVWCWNPSKKLFSSWLLLVLYLTSINNFHGHILKYFHFLGWYSKVPQTEWNEQNNFPFSQPGVWDWGIAVGSYLGPWRKDLLQASLHSVQMAVFTLNLHVIFPLSLSVFKVLLKIPVKLD